MTEAAVKIALLYVSLYVTVVKLPRWEWAHLGGVSLLGYFPSLCGCIHCSLFGDNDLTFIHKMFYLHSSHAWLCLPVCLGKINLYLFIFYW